MAGAWRIMGWMKIVLVANPTAQSGRARELVDRASELLAAAGLAHDLLPTAPDGGTVELVRSVVDDERARLLIAMGGDGTFNEVARGVLASSHVAEVTLGVLPVGTANDQGKSFGLRAGPDALADNVDVIAAGRTGWLDVGRIERLDEAGRVTAAGHFFDAASIGFTAEVLRTRNRDRDAVEQLPVLREILRDQLLYTGSALKHFFGSYVDDPKFDLEAELDGRTVRYQRLLDVVIKNTRVYCGEWVLAPDGRHDDGLFELVPIAGRRELTSKLLATLRDGLFDEDDLREIGVEHSRPVKAARIELRIVGGRGSPAAQIDGEEFGRGDHFRVAVLARRLRLVIP